MARKKSVNERDREAPKSARPRGSGILARTVSLVVLGGALMAPEQSKTCEYELPFASVPKKPVPSEGDRRFAESSRSARTLANAGSTKIKPTRPELQEAYLHTMLLDLDAGEHVVAITDCGACFCAQCTCPTTVASSSTTTVSGSCSSTSISTTTASGCSDCDCNCMMCITCGSCGTCNCNCGTNCNCNCDCMCSGNCG